MELGVVAMVMPKPPVTTSFVIGAALGVVAFFGSGHLPSMSALSKGSPRPSAQRSYGPYRSVTNEKLWVRSAPNTEAEIAAEISPDASVYVTCWTSGETVSGRRGTSSDWLKVVSPGSGYASAAFLTVNRGDVPQC